MIQADRKKVFGAPNTWKDKSKNGFYLMDDGLSLSIRGEICTTHGATQNISKSISAKILGSLGYNSK